MSEKPIALPAVDTSAQLWRHLVLHVAKYDVHCLGRMESVRKNQVREMRLILERAGLSQDAADGMPHQIHRAQSKSNAHRFDVLDHCLNHGLREVL